MFKCLLYLLFFSTIFSYSGEEKRLQVFNQVITKLKQKSQCFTNEQLITQFCDMLLKNQLGIRKNRIDFKLELDKFLSKYSYEKVWKKQYSNRYSICIRPNHYQNLHIPDKQPVIANLSINQTFEKYSYLEQHIRHQKITEMLSYLPKSLKNQMKIARYIIVDGQIFMQTYPSQDFVWNLLNSYIMQLKVTLPDMDFIIYSRSQNHEKFIFQELDYGLGETQLNFDGYIELYKRIVIELPAFMMSKDLEATLQFNKLLIIDSQITHFQNQLQQARDASEANLWDHKIQKGFWRGDGSGKPYSYVDFWIDIPIYFTRLYLVNISQSNIEYIDAKFSEQVNLDMKKVTTKNITLAIDSQTSISNHLKYKYLVALDGWTAPWITIPWILSSNSVLLKQQTKKVQWFYDQIQPNIHYIPLHRNVSNIILQIQYLKQNDQFAKNISRNAQQFIKSKLMPNNIKNTLIQILNDYAKIQKLHLTYFQKIQIKYKQSISYLKSLIVVILIGLISRIIAKPYFELIHRIYSFAIDNALIRLIKVFFEEPHEEDKNNPYAAVPSNV